MAEAVEQWMSPKEVAGRLGVSVQTVRKWINKGEIDALQPGGPETRLRIPVSEFKRVCGKRPEEKP